MIKTLYILFLGIGVLSGLVACVMWGRSRHIRNQNESYKGVYVGMGAGRQLSAIMSPSQRKSVIVLTLFISIKDLTMELLIY